MFRRGSLALAFVLACLAVSGCGRSSLIGGPGGGGGNTDLGPDMFMCPGETQCAGMCNRPECCACNVCQFNPLCSPPDLGGDGFDPCASKQNCKLPICVGDPRCVTPGAEICNNGLDDDDDNLVDCKDPDCAQFPNCQPHKCDDANPDCSDPACVDHPKCKDLKCKPTVDFGTLPPMSGMSTRSVDTRNTTDVTVTPCAPGGAGMVVGKVTLSGRADLTLSYTQDKNKDHVFGLFKAGINQQCGQNPVGCFDPKGAESGKHTFPAQPAGDYYVIVQPFSPQGQGMVTVTLSTPSMKEICNNGVDDNGNGLIDCADGDCVNDANCINQRCQPDINVGALVVNAGPKSASFDTGNGDSDNELSCQAAKGGKDVIVRFTLHETAGVLMDWSQSGDHVVGLFKMPGPGQKCDAQQLGCYDPSGRNQDTVAWGELPAGDYMFIWKALRPGEEGQVDVQLSAYRNRKIELCHNGIDDDNNGLVDCDDPACTGVSGCSAPYCMPHVNLGQMAVGDSRNTQLNIKQNGTVGFDSTCDKGGAKGMVLQLNVPQTGMGGGIGIGFECQQQGDHVLALYAAGGPRDACDVNELVCADPKTLPFGCGYIVPNLQPGTYNVIALGFQPGSEGTLSLTLSIWDDRQLEICNNNIDDDKDGFKDCFDRKCAVSPHCRTNQCNPDSSIDPMPLTGAAVNRLLQTQGAPVQAQLSCASMAGGSTGVIEITLTAKANLTVEYLQFGNHDFALYTKEGTLLPCTAGAQVGSCQKSNGSQNGMFSFSNVPQGKYYFVIAADTPLTSGSVAVVFKGMPAP